MADTEKSELKDINNAISQRDGATRGGSALMININKGSRLDNILSNLLSTAKQQYSYLNQITNKSSNDQNINTNNSRIKPKEEDESTLKIISKSILSSLIGSDVTNILFSKSENEKNKSENKKAAPKISSDNNVNVSKDIILMDYAQGSNLDKTLVSIKDAIIKSTDYLKILADDVIEKRNKAEEASVSSSVMANRGNLDKLANLSALTPAAAGGLLGAGGGNGNGGDSSSFSDIMSQLGVSLGISAGWEGVKAGWNKLFGKPVTPPEAVTPEPIKGPAGEPVDIENLKSTAALKAEEAERLKLEADAKMARSKADILNSERTGERLYGATEKAARAKAFKDSQMLYREAAEAKAAAEAADEAAKAVKTGNSLKGLGKVGNFLRGLGPLINAGLIGYGAYIDVESGAAKTTEQAGVANAAALPLDFIDSIFNLMSGKAVEDIFGDYFGLKTKIDWSNMTEEERKKMMMGLSMGGGSMALSYGMNDGAPSLNLGGLFRDFFYRTRRSDLDKIYSETDPRRALALQNSLMEFGVDRDRQRVIAGDRSILQSITPKTGPAAAPIPTAATITAPETALSSSQSPVIIAPINGPAGAPASVVTNSNNTTNVYNINKDNNDSFLGLQMLGGGSSDVPGLYAFGS